MITPTQPNWKPTAKELMQMLRDALNTFACVLEAIAHHPDIFPIPDMPSADTPPTLKRDKNTSQINKMCANCGTEPALDHWLLCYECAEDIAFESYEIGEPITFSDEAKRIMALYDTEDDEE
jgi:hypothetical protein